MKNLEGRKVAILATDGFEQVELTEPRRALEEAGATVEIVSPRGGEIQGFNHFEKGRKVHVDRRLGDTYPDEYDALVIPGGVFNPDQLRANADATNFARAFVDADKTVAAICHAPWVLIDARVVSGRTMTGVRAIRSDLANAGARVVDQGVAVDGHLLTGRGPDDLPAFCTKLVELVHGEPPRVEKTWALI